MFKFAKLVLAKYLLAINLLCILSLVHANPNPEKPKLLVLIIASDNQPIYVELQKVWRQYMQLDPEHITAYFIKADPELANTTEIISDTIWSRSIENPYPGILNKTIMSLIALESQLAEFDYILRADLSSFYVFPKLLAFLQTCPRHRFYDGSGDIGVNMASGCGFLLSTDVARLIIAQQAQLFKQADSGPDDCVIANFMASQGIKVQCHDRYDWLAGDKYYYRRACKQRLLRTRVPMPDAAFHIRIKNNQPELRLTQDLALCRDFLQHYYAIS